MTGTISEVRIHGSCSPVRETKINRCVLVAQMVKNLPATQETWV